MKIREQVIKELSDLNPIEVLRVYYFIRSFKSGTADTKRRGTCSAYLKTRKALRNCSGTLADDVLADREERI
ncbi:MAG: hypothetical protein GY765_26600 [bacterium]|nr:hypothetical protein [bacterium]